MAGPVGVVLEEIDLELLVLDLQLSLHLAVLDVVPYHDEQDGDGCEYGEHHIPVGGRLRSPELNIGRGIWVVLWGEMD